MDLGAVLIILAIFTGVSIVVDFVNFLMHGKRLFQKFVNRTFDVIALIANPILLLLVFDFGMENDCCDESALFSPDHRTSIYVLIVVCVLAYAYSVLRKKLAGPLLEVIVNALLIIAIVLNIFIFIHLDSYIGLLGIPTIILLFMMALIENHRKLTDYAASFEKEGRNKITLWMMEILELRSFSKFPILILLCLPVLSLIMSILILFGQKPDSFVRAFTDTYKHGLSQIDYLCDNVICGGHFLCSVAANGHNTIVKPKRYGSRAGNRIICNRQLLVSNAFEELIQKKMKRGHGFIRKNYNKIGNLIHKYYWVFEKKIVSDVIFILMKPLEWIFTIYIYLVDPNPENRIAKQYLPIEDQKSIDKHLEN